MSTKLELLDPTHRGLHRFVPRHNDEIEIDIGDPVYVQKEAEDLWCEGRTNCCIFRPAFGCCALQTLVEIV